MWLANFLHVEDYSYIEGMTQAGMVDKIVEGVSFPHAAAEKRNYRLVRPDIHSSFTHFRYT